MRENPSEAYGTPKKISRRPAVAVSRNYSVQNVTDAKNVAVMWLKPYQLDNAIDFGLPEVDDRYHVWRIPLLRRGSRERIGEVVIHARTSLVLQEKSTAPEIIENRLLGRNATDVHVMSGQTIISFVRNTLMQGDAGHRTLDLPSQSVHLIFTSPPYYNARPEYEEYLSYEEYLLKMRKVIHACHEVLAEGRFFVLNVSPVLIRRPSRGEASKRLAVPFDFHQLFLSEGFDFIDDIIWEKPEGAGWATGRGRRFAADRNPLQYKPVPVTEYVLVYRKHTEKLIDWNIRYHHDQGAVRRSKIAGDYDVTNVWKLPPAHSPSHPAVFPLELAQKVIRYYSFEGDVVLDPFAGIGTTGKAAISMKRRFVLIEKEPEYVQVIRDEITNWLGKAASDVLYVGCEPADTSELLAI